MTGASRVRRAAVCLVAGVALCALAAAAGPRVVRVPAKQADSGANSLAARAAAQKKDAASIRVEHAFRFTDRLPESGITFVHRITDDSGRDYKPNHYDHGTGIAIADVDGDGLPDVYFVNQIGGNQLWRNLGHGKFANITDSAGVALADRISVTATFADVDNDGDEDLYVTTVRGGNVLFLNDGKGHFRDASKESGLDYVGHSSGAVFFDYDNDGLLDLFLCNVGRYTTDAKGRGGYYVGFADAFSGHLMPERAERSRLYRNLGGGRFADVTDAVGLPQTGWSGDASFTDLDGDGFPDLYVLNMQGANHFLHNDGGKRFVDETAAHFPKTPWGAMGVKFFDFDGDGRMDLYVTDMHSDMSQEIGPEKENLKSEMKWTEHFLQDGAHSIFGNAFYRSLGEGKFEEISDRIGVENYWPWGPSIGDLNADGWEDVFVAASMSFPFRYGIDSVFLNDRGERFRDAEFILGVEPRRGERTTTSWFDADCSVPQTGAGAKRACVDQAGPIRVLGTLGTRSAAIMDLDGDGDLDIVTNEFNAAPQILVSDLAQRKTIHWLKVALSGTASNRDGLGAVVRVTAAGRVQTHAHDGKSGYLSQSSLPLYFGLGSASEVERVEVLWPSGRRSVVEKPKANATLGIEEARQ
ncbi:MAG TPA: CRTAC1 family protein [Thermoanaerobaculia bacterium]